MPPQRDDTEPLLTLAELKGKILLKAKMKEKKSDPSIPTTLAHLVHFRTVEYMPLRKGGLKMTTIFYLTYK